jgi:hypothetical protein
MLGVTASRPLDSGCGPVDEENQARLETFANDRCGDARAATDLQDAVRSFEGERLDRPADPFGSRCGHLKKITLDNEHGLVSTSRWSLHLNIWHQLARRARGLM